MSDWAVLLCIVMVATIISVVTQIRDNKVHRKWMKDFKDKHPRVDEFERSIYDSYRQNSEKRE
jgi:hypothetical protein